MIHLPTATQSGGVLEACGVEVPVTDSSFTSIAWNSHHAMLLELALYDETERHCVRLLQQFVLFACQ